MLRTSSFLIGITVPTLGLILSSCSGYFPLRSQRSDLQNATKTPLHMEMEPKVVLTSTPIPSTVPDPGEKAVSNKNNPPVDYHGDPLYWISGVEYELVCGSNGEIDSYPIIPDEKSEQISEAFTRYRAKQGKRVSNEQAAEIEVKVLTEGMSALDAAKYIKVTFGGPLYLNYAREFADRALNENPDDFNVRLIWTELQPTRSEKKIKAYRKLMKIEPNHARVLFGLAMNVSDVKESIGYLEKAKAINDEVYQRQVLTELGYRYKAIGENEKALENLKGAEAIHPLHTVSQLQFYQSTRTINR